MAGSVKTNVRLQRHFFSICYNKTLTSIDAQQEEREEKINVMRLLGIVHYGHKIKNEVKDFISTIIANTTIELKT